MLFNSYTFFVFFIIVYALYRCLPRRQQNWLLLAASYFFYAAWDWRFLSLIWLSTAVDFVCARQMAVRRIVSQRRFCLIVSCVVNLGLLGVFKYYGFLPTASNDS